MTISYDDAWKCLPPGHPDNVMGEDLPVIRFAPTPQWNVLANVAMWWRYGQDYDSGEHSMNDIKAAMKAFADRYPEIIKKIEREIPVSGPVPDRFPLTDFLPLQ